MSIAIDLTDLPDLTDFEFRKNPNDMPVSPTGSLKLEDRNTMNDGIILLFQILLFTVIIWSAIFALAKF